MSKKTIFFCGAMLNHEGLKRYKGETPAASIWLKGFFGGLIENGVHVKCFSPIWDSLFPKGRLFPGNVKYLDNLVEHVLVRYLNVPFLRTYSVALSLERAIVKAIKKGNGPIAILNYNTYPYYTKALKKVSKKFPQIPWINIVLDLDDPIEDNWKAFLTDTEGSSGSVFLSWWGYQNVPISNKHHMDAGWNGELPDVSINESKIFLYAGKYAKFGGIDDIIDAIKLFPDRNALFLFYGKDVYEPLTKLSQEDSRVKIMGFVTDEELDIACKKATAFLSPREFNFQGTRMIFPSKIMFYLKYQKPIVSAFLPGLSPEYNEILVSPNDNTAEAWSLAMEKVLNYSNEDLAKIELKSKALLAMKTWKIQTTALLDFIKSV